MRRMRTGGFLAISMMLAIQAQGAALRVAPVSLALQPGQQAIALTLSNPSDRPLVAQVRISAWSQVETEDRLEAESDVVVSPPIATVGPRGEQVVRVIRLNHATPARELTYRLLVDELPDDAQSPKSAIDIRLRYSVPLFVLPPGLQAGPHLTWQLRRHHAGWYLRITNSGDLHAQVSAVNLVAPDSSAFDVSPGLLGYSLTDSAREWQLPATVNLSTGTGIARIHAIVNGSPVDVSASLSDSIAD